MACGRGWRIDKGFWVTAGPGDRCMRLEWREA